MNLCMECLSDDHTTEQHHKIFKYWMDKIDKKGGGNDSNVIKETGSWLSFTLPFPKISKESWKNLVENSSVIGLEAGPTVISSYDAMAEQWNTVD